MRSCRVIPIPRVLAWLLSRASIAISASAAAPAGNTKIPEPPLPAIRSQQLQPESLVLKDGRDERRVLVSGVTEEGGNIGTVDLTAGATVESGANGVEVMTGGYLRPRSKGSTEITIRAVGLTAKLPVTNHLNQRRELVDARFGEPVTGLFV